METLAYLELASGIYDAHLMPLFCRTRACPALFIQPSQTMVSWKFVLVHTCLPQTQQKKIFSPVALKNLDWVMSSCQLANLSQQTTSFGNKFLKQT